MKTMQAAGRGKVGDMKGMAKARTLMHAEYLEARFEAKAFRAARPYRSQVMRSVYASHLRSLHNAARAALRNLNALKAPKLDCTVCGECEPVAAYGGWCCVKALKAEVTP